MAEDEGRRRPLKAKEKRLDGDVINCCDDPPPTCPRRYCSIAFRSFERDIGAPEPVKKKKKPTGGNHAKRLQ
jgi:hypothetical protein